MGVKRSRIGDICRGKITGFSIDSLGCHDSASRLAPPTSCSLSLFVKFQKGLLWGTTIHCILPGLGAVQFISHHKKPWAVPYCSLHTLRASRAISIVIVTLQSRLLLSCMPIHNITYTRYKSQSPPRFPLSPAPAGAPISELTAFDRQTGPGTCPPPTFSTARSVDPAPGTPSRDSWRRPTSSL